MVNTFWAALVVVSIGIGSSVGVGYSIGQEIGSINRINIDLEQCVEEKLNNSPDMQWMTSQNKVLEVKWNEGQVIVDLQPDMLGYGGGTYMEYILGALIMQAIFENSDAKDITILVEGASDKFPEGSEYVKLTRAHYETYYKNFENTKD